MSATFLIVNILLWALVAALALTAAVRSKALFREGAREGSRDFVVLLPRILIGVVAFLVYRALRPFNEVVALLAAGVLGTATNTVLVLSMAVLLKGPNGAPYLPADVAWGVAGTNGIPEAIAGGIITLAVGLAVRGVGRARKSTV